MLHHLQHTTPTASLPGDKAILIVIVLVMRTHLPPRLHAHADNERMHGSDHHHHPSGGLHHLGLLDEGTAPPANQHYLASHVVGEGVTRLGGVGHGEGQGGGGVGDLGREGRGEEGRGGKGREVSMREDIDKIAARCYVGHYTRTIERTNERTHELTKELTHLGSKVGQKILDRKVLSLFVAFRNPFPRTASITGENVHDTAVVHIGCFGTFLECYWTAVGAAAFAVDWNDITAGR